jgi:hypothetical protein
VGRATAARAPTWRSRVGRRRRKIALTKGTGGPKGRSLKATVDGPLKDNVYVFTYK